MSAIPVTSTRTAERAEASHETSLTPREQRFVVTVRRLLAHLEASEEERLELLTAIALHKHAVRRLNQEVERGRRANDLLRGQLAHAQRAARGEVTS